MSKHTKPADGWHPWNNYIDAREEARRRGDRRVGTEHLILALLGEPVVAAALGCDQQAARDALAAMDRDALAAVGLDAAIDAPWIPADEPVSRSAGAAFKAAVRDRMPMTPVAKATMEQAYKEVRRGEGAGPQQTLLALLELTPPDPAAELFAALGVDRGAARGALGPDRAAA